MADIPKEARHPCDIAFSAGMIIGMVVGVILGFLIGWYS